jgi:hypothetical protein
MPARADLRTEGMMRLSRLRAARRMTAGSSPLMREKRARFLQRDEQAEGSIPQAKSDAKEGM